MAKKQTAGAPLSRLGSYDDETRTLNAIIDTPKDSRNKYTYEEKYGLFVLKGVLFAGASFPYDFGFIPSTKGGDGDPLDVLVLMDEPAFTGALVPSRLIGVIEAEQTEEGKTTRNDRLIAVADNSRNHQEITTLDDLSENLLGEIEHFFISYNEAKGKVFKPLGRFGPDRAQKIVAAGEALFRRPAKKGSKKASSQRQTKKKKRKSSSRARKV
ncbi:MAG TPA: inorganic diphosphatase [Pyrinomonadaceae bacterium]|jgi:inorganic pyrophosphatase|nr:inorganic diphosphatase [Pyrinomonadaceae bacterium]